MQQIFSSLQTHFCHTKIYSPGVSFIFVALPAIFIRMQQVHKCPYHLRMQFFFHYPLEVDATFQRRVTQNELQQCTPQTKVSETVQVICPGITPWLVYIYVHRLKVRSPSLMIYTFQNSRRRQIYTNCYHKSSKFPFVERFLCYSLSAIHRPCSHPLTLHSCLSNVTPR